MRAFHIRKDGDTPELTDVPSPVPGPGEVLLNIKACGLNFADLLMVSGTYQDTPPAPFTLGMEVAGEVSACGPDVTTLQPGQRVVVFGGRGGLAEQGVFPVTQCVPLDDRVSFEDAAAFQIAYGTSHVALDYRANLQPGDQVLLHAGCDKTQGVCKAKFGNLLNFQGFPFIPGEDWLVSVPIRAGQNDGGALV